MLADDIKLSMSNHPELWTMIPDGMRSAESTFCEMSREIEVSIE
jgi:hypothetical protein